MRNHLVAFVVLVALGLATVACSSSGGTPEPIPDRSAGCDAPDPSFVTESGSYEHDGVTRTYRLSAPETATSGTDPTAVPLVVDMHGASGGIVEQGLRSGMAPIAEREGFALLAPQAGDDERNSWFVDPDGPDVAYLVSLLDDVEDSICIDPRRVYLTGFSQGGMLSLILSCQDPERFAAIAPVAGFVEVEGCERDTPVPLIAFHGTEDDVVGYDGVQDPIVEAMVGYAEGPSVPELAATWATDNGCDEPTPDTVRTEVAGTEQAVFDCPDGPVELYSVTGGGHGWPPEASELIWQFFDAHPRP